MLGDDDGLSSKPLRLFSNPDDLSRDLAALSRDLDSLDKAEAEQKAKVRQTLLAGLPGELAVRAGATKPALCGARRRPRPLASAQLACERIGAASATQLGVRATEIRSAFAGSRAHPKDPT